MAQAPLHSNRRGIVWTILLLFLVIILFLLQFQKYIQNRTGEDVDSRTDRHGEIRIISNPAAATLIVNGKKLGKTPFTVKDIAFGSLVVEISKPGYRNHKQTLQVNSPEPRQVTVDLLPCTGSLQLTSSPSHADIVINGKYRGVTPLTLTDLPLGYLDIVVKKGCYQTIRQRLKISDGSKESLNFTLEYSCGNLEVTSMPSGADVFVAGSKRGVTPYTMTGVKVGDMELILKKKGYDNKKKMISIKAGQTAREMIIFNRPKTPGAGDTWQEPETGIEFVWIKGGCYQMGNPESEKLRLKIAEKQNHRIRSFFAGIISAITDSNPDEEDDDSHDIDEAPVHEVCVNDGWVATKEITNEQFLLFSTATGIKPEWCQEKNEFNIKSGKNTYYRQVGGSGLFGDSRPVVGVSWYDAQEFTDWFSRLTGYYARLLTEAEWEYVCRSGGKNEEFAGGNMPDQLAWFADNSDNECHDVGRLQANGVGLFDMSGNVWEWTMDTYDPNAYERNNKMDPVVLNSQEDQPRKVVRGGSWRSKAESLRCTSRYGLPPDDRHAFLGFRIIMVEKTQ